MHLCKKDEDSIMRFEHMLEEKSINAPIPESCEYMELMGNKANVFCELSKSMDMEERAKLARFDMYWCLIDQYRQDEKYKQGFRDAVKQIMELCGK